MRKYHFLRHPQTTQERRQSSVCTDWKDDYGKVKLRPNRNQTNLPDTWDDIHIFSQKTWKKKRKTQYRQAGLRTEANQYELILCLDIEDLPIPFHSEEWHYINTYRYEQYFLDNDIPFVILPIKQERIWWSRLREEWRSANYTVGNHIIWWSFTDIGIDKYGLPHDNCWHI